MTTPNPIPNFADLHAGLNRFLLACSIPIIKGKIVVGTLGRGDLYLTIESPSPVINFPPEKPNIPGLKAGVADSITDGVKDSRYTASVPTATPEAWDFMASVIRQALT